MAVPPNVTKKLDGVAYDTVTVDDPALVEVAKNCAGSNLSQSQTDDLPVLGFGASGPKPLDPSVLMQRALRRRKYTLEHCWGDPIRRDPPKQKRS